jgi:hypothetical protein
MTKRNSLLTVVVVFAGMILNITAFAMPALDKSEKQQGYMVTSFFKSTSCNDHSRRGALEYVPLGECIVNEYQVTKRKLAAFAVHWAEKTDNGRHYVLHTQGFADNECTRPVGEQTEIEFSTGQCLAGVGDEKLNVKLKFSRAPPTHDTGIVISEYANKDCADRNASYPMTTWLRDNMCHNVSVSQSLYAKSMMPSCGSQTFIEFQQPNCVGASTPYRLADLKGCMSSGRRTSVQIACKSPFPPSSEPTIFPSAEPTGEPTMAPTALPTIGATVREVDLQGIPNLALWYDADDTSTLVSNTGFPVNEGSSVQTWKDKSGNGYDLTNQYGDEPVWVDDVVNGHPAVRFTASGKTTGTQLRGTHNLGSDSVSYFVVFQWRELHRTYGIDVIFTLGSEFDGAAGSVGTDGTLDKVSLHNHQFSGPAVALNEFRVGSLVYDSSTNLESAYINNINVGTVTATSGTIRPSTILGSWDAAWVTGWNSPYPEYFCDADIAEIIVFNRAVSDEERNTIAEYLSDKYVGLYAMESCICEGYKDFSKKSGACLCTLHPILPM